MRRWILSILILILLAAGAFFTLAPGLIEKDLNRIDGKPLPAVSERAQALHRTLTIVDLHSDSLLWSRNFLDRAGRGHMDLPRLEDGHVALQVLASTTKSPKGQNYDANGSDTDNITSLVIAQLQPVRTWNSLLERSLWHGEKLHRAVAASSGKLRAITTPENIDALLASRRGKMPPVGAMLSIEGLHGLEGKLANLDKLYAAGFRMAGLTHFFDNDLAGSMHGLKKGGLTPTGRQVIAAMEAKGMIVDIAHCSNACVADILKMARRPVVSSHGGVQATCKVNRNLSDAQIRGVAATGGLIGIGYWDAAVCDTSPASIAKAMKHVRDLVGIQHVALGSDYDGATTVRFDTSKLAQVTQALIDAGFSDDEIRAAMGGNAIRVLKAGLVPLTPPAP
ncbi:MAG TPA: dipeptidase [Sphingopyxis sp.]|nr:dipeptidase [Sphingopyxis sp.]